MIKENVTTAVVEPFTGHTTHTVFPYAELEIPVVIMSFTIICLSGNLKFELFPEPLVSKRNSSIRLIHFFEYEVDPYV